MQTTPSPIVTITVIILFAFAVAGLWKLLQYLVRYLRAGRPGREASQTCPRCGRFFRAGEKFCPECGAPAPLRNPVCRICYTPLKPGEKFCPRCGSPVSEPAVPPPAAFPTQVSAPERSGKKTWLVLGGAAILILASYLFFKNFKGSSITIGNLNRYPPYETLGFSDQTTIDSQIRYSLADVQLGGQAVLNYYRKYGDNTAVQKMLDIWDSGDRVLNIYHFQRALATDGSWAVLIGGTQLVAGGDDIVLPGYVNAGGNQEAQVRYILADAQLASSIEYYRQYRSVPAVAEAVRRWDAGVRVRNINQFGMADNGMKVIATGNSQLVDATHILLSSDMAVTPDFCATGAGRINYIIADIQLGGVDDYYRQYTNDPVITEALRQWDAGVRVANLASFERKVVGSSGWLITNAGSGQQVRCEDIQLTGASQAQAPGNWGVCNNPYYPTTPGAAWTLHDSINNVDYNLQIVSAQSDGNGGGSFQLDNNGAVEQYTCDPDGAIRFSDKSLRVPPPAQFQSGNVYTDPLSHLAFRMEGPDSISAPAGIFKDCYSPVLLGTDIPYSVSYCYGVGMVRLMLDANTFGLSSYSIP